MLLLGVFNVHTLYTGIVVGSIVKIKFATQKLLKAATKMLTFTSAHIVYALLNVLSAVGLLVKYLPIMLRQLSNAVFVLHPVCSFLV